MKIDIETIVKPPLEKTWSAWTNPEDIVGWNFASDDWACPKAEINLIVGGSFNYRMEAKDGSVGFDFEGEFTKIEEFKLIEYKLSDDRKVQVQFEKADDGTKVIETFEAEDQATAEQQKAGWQCILENFKKHVEGK